jgi:hypothetical protein
VLHYSRLEYKIKLVILVLKILVTIHRLNKISEHSIYIIYSVVFLGRFEWIKIYVVYLELDVMCLKTEKIISVKKIISNLIKQQKYQI